MISKIKKGIGFFLFTILIFMLFLWLRYPPDFIESQVISKISETNPRATVSMDDARLSLPAGIELRKLKIVFKDLGNSTLEAERLAAQIQLLNLLTGRFSYRMNGDAYRGNVAAKVSFRKYFSTDGPVESDVRFEGIHIGECSYMKAVLGRVISGNLSGRFLFEGLREDAADGSGRIELVLADGYFQLLQDFFGMDRIAFKKLEGEAALMNRTLKINRLILVGDHFQGTFRGNIVLENDFSKSRLDIKGEMDVPLAKMRNQSMLLTGTVENPVFNAL
jgi:type II secretion system protein N